MLHAQGGASSLAPNQAVSQADAKKTLARIYGYMAIGLAITAVVSFVIALVFALIVGPAVMGEGATKEQIAAAENAFTVYTIVLVVSGVLLLGVTIVLSILARRVMLGRSSKTSVLVPYLLYAALMGVFFSAFMIAGIDFWTMAEAFGITALVFGTMFVIGYYTKVNLSIIATTLMSLLMSLILISLLFTILALATGKGFGAYALDMIISVVMTVYVLIIVAIDGNNIKRLIDAGQMTRELEVTFAMDMYVDFIYIFMRVLALIVALKDN